MRAFCNSAFRLQWVILQIAAILILAVPALRAQTITGSIRGTVEDLSGAVVPSAKVTATNQETKVVTSTTTTRSGTYNIQFLPIGTYTITISSSGFQTALMGPFQLQIDQTVKMDAKLSVGNVSTTVKVSSNTVPILQTQNATLGTTISRNTLANLPMNGLNFQFPTLFVPGAVLPSVASMASADGNERDVDWYSSPSFNGARGQDNDYIMDGIEINETLNNYSAYNPAPDSIQEMRVITANADAEYGNVGGGGVLVVTRGGTNRFHGSLYEFFQNNDMEANTWANNLSDIPLAAFTQNQFGGSFGGPIIKNKLFFFGDYEGFRYHTGGTGVATVATTQMRAGDFSQLLTSQYGDIQLYDNQNGGGFGNATAYRNDQVPVLNPVAKYLFAHPELYPLPNAQPVAGLGDYDNYHGYYKSQTENNQGDIRIDYKVDSKDSLMGRYSYGDALNFEPQPLISVIFPNASDYPFQSVVLNWVHTLSASMINEFRAGYSRTVYDQDIPSDPSGVFGTNGNSVVGIPFNKQIFAGFSEIAFSSNESNFGTSALVNEFHENNFDYGDDFTWQHGNHTTKFGVQVLRYQQNSFYPGNAGALGSFSYTGAYTQDASVNQPGYGFADFVLDQSAGASIGGVAGPTGQRQYRDAAYVQDDWRVRHNLTLNLGLRYGYDQPIYEVNNKQANLLNSYLENPNPEIPAVNVIRYAGQDGASRALYNPYFWEFMPRFGFALEATHRLVFRGAYGITEDLEGTGTNHRLTQNAPFLSQFSYSPTPPTATSDGAGPIPVENGFSISSGNATYSNNNFNAFPADLKPAIVQQFNLGWQYLITQNTSAQLGYVGSLSQHLMVPVQANQWPSPATGAAAATDCSGTVEAAAPYCGVVSNYGNMYITESEGIANYNALQATLHHQNSGGFEYTINYTWARSMTNNAGFYGVAGVSESSSFFQNVYDPMGDYGPSGDDTRNSLNAQGVFTLPFGHGRRFGAHWNTLTDEVLGGWKLSGDAILYSGFPLSMHSSENYFVYANAAHAIHFRRLQIVNRSVQHWFGTDPSATPCLSTDSAGNTIDNGVCAYGNESYTGFGNAQNGSERAPGYRQVDISAFKTFRIMRSQSLELRGDAFNVGNIASYSAPNAILNDAPSGTFGRITSTLSSPRVMQVSMHYRF